MLFESFFEAPPQASLQFALAIMTAAIYGAGEGMEEKYLSIAISVVSMVSNFLSILDGARKSEEPVATYVEEVLRVGVGHIPHIAAIRDGKLEQADFSNVPEKLLLEDGGQGLKRIFDAMGDGDMKLKRIVFSREGVVHNLNELVELVDSRGENDIGERTRSRDRGGTKITVALSSHATEAEGLFLGTLLEARAGLGTVVLVRKGGEREQGGATGSGAATGQEKEDRVRSAGSGMLSFKRNKETNQGNIGVAAAQIACAFLRRTRKAAAGLRAPWAELDMSGIQFSEDECDAFVEKVVQVLEESKDEATAPRRSLLRRLQIRRSTVRMAPLPNIAVLLGVVSDGENGRVVPEGGLDHRKVIKIGRHVLAASAFAHGSFGGRTFDAWLKMRERRRRARQKVLEEEARAAREREWELERDELRADESRRGGMYVGICSGIVILSFVVVFVSSALSG